METVTLRRFRAGDEYAVSDLICTTLAISNRKDYSPEFIEENIRSHSSEVIAARAEEAHFDEETIFYPSLCAGGCRRRLCHLCRGASGDVVSVEHPDHSHPLRSVCGCGHTAVCAGVVEKATFLNVMTLLLEPGAVFFLIQSILTVIPVGSSSWYLPLALGLNCIALFLNAVQQRKQKREDEQKV